MQWIKDNVHGLVVLAFALVVGVTLFLAQGCSIDDLVKADMPREVQAKLGVPPKVPLSQARELISEYNLKIEREAKDRAGEITAFQRRAARELEQLSESLQAEADTKAADLEEFKRTSERVGAALAARVQHAGEVAGFLESLVNTGLGAAQASGLGALPGGGIALAALTGLGGLLIRKPGTQKEIDAAYEEGRAAAKADAKA